MDKANDFINAEHTPRALTDPQKAKMDDVDRKAKYASKANKERVKEERKQERGG